MKSNNINPTFILIGSGIAGLNSAIKLSKFGKVLVLTKDKLRKSATNLAQGGIAGVLSAFDSEEKHYKDTLEAGCYHNKKSAVRFLVKNSKIAINELLNYGVRFSKNKKGLMLTKEGGHSVNRIAYAGDFTGKEIMRALLYSTKKNPNIRMLETAFVTDFIVKKNKCYGVKVLSDGYISEIYAPYTIICSGGIGQIFDSTTNPNVATGDGIGMAFRAKAKLKDMEFIQFHPTILNLPHKNWAFLLSEALRGEGAIIINQKGERFLKKYSEKAELAPRHIVAKYCYLESLKGPIYLKLNNKKAGNLKKRFPTIYKKLIENNLRLEKDRIPTSPAAHYLCGGIYTNLKGQTSIKNLCAVGEISCTGIHGANRLASNSLLEGIVFSNAIHNSLNEKSVLKEIRSFNKRKFEPNIIKEEKLTTKEKMILGHIKKKIKKTMWEKVGIVRKHSQLKEALEDIKVLTTKLDAIKNKLNRNYLEIENMLISAELISKAAFKRGKSLGAHYVV